MSTAKDCSNERMRYLLYETNEIQTQKNWHSTDEEVLEPVAKKEFNPMMTTPHLVESLKKIPQMGN